MLKLNLNVGDEPQRIQIGEATVHIKKVGERKLSLSIEAPREIRIVATGGSAAVASGKAVAD